VKGLTYINPWMEAFFGTPGRQGEEGSVVQEEGGTAEASPEIIHQSRRQQSR